MKGIVLAGGTGSRLHPLTLGVSKQLLPIYDKPMIFYPISVLMLAGINDILIITTPEDEPSFRRLLGDGSKFKISISYKLQLNPDGIAQAFILGEDFIGNDDVCLVLGDNFVYGPNLTKKLRRSVKYVTETKHATLFGYQVKDPRSFGVVEFDKNNKVLSIEEKPTIPKSNFAVIGIYFYPNSVVSVAKQVKPSERNELEISSVNNHYLLKDEINVEILGRGFAWFDTGTPDNLLQAANFVQTIQHNQGYKIACLEEIAFAAGWMTTDEIVDRARLLRNSGYGQYLLSLGKV